MYMYNIHGNNINSSNCSQNIKFNNKFKFNNNLTCSSDPGDVIGKGDGISK